MSLKIIKASLLDTVQDAGRYGHRHLGINCSGAMDRFAALLGNALLGKKLNAPAVEMHFPGPQILFQQDAVICITGGDFTPAINGEEVFMNTPVLVKKESLLFFQKKRSGARCYLSVLNELEIGPWLNSYSTNLKASAGGYKGRQLKKGDEISFEQIQVTATTTLHYLPWKYHFEAQNTNEIFFLPGPEWDWLTTKSQTDFLNGTYLITPASDRMGYRLKGDALVQKDATQLVSSAVNFGTVQCLPNGQLIVLMADHQTTGGYPRIATVISTQLPKLAQMNAGDSFRFAMTTIDDAEEKAVTQQKFLQALQNTCNLKTQTWLNANRH